MAPKRKSFKEHSRSQATVWWNKFFLHSRSAGAVALLERSSCKCTSEASFNRTANHHLLNGNTFSSFSALLLHWIFTASLALTSRSRNRFSWCELENTKHSWAIPSFSQILFLILSSKSTSSHFPFLRQMIFLNIPGSSKSREGMAPHGAHMHRSVSNYLNTWSFTCCGHAPGRKVRNWQSRSGLKKPMRTSSNFCALEPCVRAKLKSLHPHLIQQRFFTPPPSVLVQRSRNLESESKFQRSKFRIQLQSSCSVEKFGKLLKHKSSQLFWEQHVGCINRTRTSSSLSTPYLFLFISHTDTSNRINLQMQTKKTPCAESLFNIHVCNPEAIWRTDNLLCLINFILDGDSASFTFQRHHIQFKRNCKGSPSLHKHTNKQDKRPAGATHVIFSGSLFIRVPI